MDDQLKYKEIVKNKYENLFRSQMFQITIPIDPEIIK
jgi:hypothetical protein